MASPDPVAIIDIGSNSVRLVVYGGPARVPAPIFNEKVLAGLGSGLDKTGSLKPSARAKALAALERFKILLGHMRVTKVRVLATAAIRDADDGPDFVRDARRIGFHCEVIPAEEEARLAGEGVISGIPEADGIVGDLGGGSLELVDVAGGKARPGISLPLGVLRIGVSAEDEKAARKTIRSALKDAGMIDRGRGRALYLVGGSWRALARIDMLASDYPLPITHQYTMAPERALALRKILASIDPKWAKAAAPARHATAPAAAMLLSVLVEAIEPSALVVSTFGIREGLLYSQLRAAQRRADPLIAATRDAASHDQMFGRHGDLLDHWIGTIFDDPPVMHRLRLAACLLADVAWQANPAFRAGRGVEMALHGNWVGVDAPGRVIMAQALASNFGRDKLIDARLAELCGAGPLRRARAWGSAMRLAQRVSGGVPSVLEATRLRIDATGLLLLDVAPGEEALLGDPVKRRLARLAEAIGLRADAAGAAG